MSKESNQIRLFATPFADIYVLYVKKVERKGRSVADLNRVITWLTGFEQDTLDALIAARVTLKEFFDKASINPNASLITGTICGVKVQEVTDSLMRNIRYMDKLVDEVALGRSMEKILRQPS